MSELAEKVKRSIEWVRNFEPEEGYYLAFSGGKDSVVTKAILDLAGVKYDSHYSVTSADPPELVRFVKEKRPDTELVFPRYKDGKVITMWNLIVKKGFPPTRIARYCCAALKETAGDGRKCVTGVRWAESYNRKMNQGIVTVVGKTPAKELKDSPDFAQTKREGVVLVNDNTESRRMIESCYKRGKVTVNPIIDWEDRDVWEFIRAEKIPYCGLYDEGWTRLGCVGCPMSRRREREREFNRWPKYKENYIKAFARMNEEREKKGKRPFEGYWGDGSAESVFRWWMEYDDIPGQISLFDEEDG